jgi:hypothetical protein
MSIGAHAWAHGRRRLGRRRDMPPPGDSRAGACTGSTGDWIVKPPEVNLETAATIRDIMDSMVDPSADFLFDSVAMISDARGTTEKAPHTDEEWKEVKWRAIRSLEAPKPARHAGPQGRVGPRKIRESRDRAAATSTQRLCRRPRRLAPWPRPTGASARTRELGPRQFDTPAASLRLLAPNHHPQRPAPM